MDRGTYIGAATGKYQNLKLEIIANNIANVNTPGYKKQLLTETAVTFEDTLAGLSGNPKAALSAKVTPTAAAFEAKTDFSLGPIKNTGNPLDAALRKEKDFFVIQGGDGTLQYTRAGNFTLNEEGQLATQDGAVVLGDGGPITIAGGSAKITAAGIVTVNGVSVGKLRIVHIEDPINLKRIGHTRFALPAGSPQPVPIDDPELIPHALEMSNVSMVSSMIELIKASKGFELYSKVAKGIDEMNQTAINRVGRRT